MRSRTLVAPLLLLLVSAALGPGLLAPAAATGAAERSHVVIAVIDTGINPYHLEFRDAALTAHPSTYIEGYPAAATSLALCLDAAANPSCNTMDGALARDAASWDALPAMGRDADGWNDAALHFVPGTRIIGAASFGDLDDPFVGPRRVLDDYDPASKHGTAVASLAAGLLSGRCPQCLLVVVEGPSTAALEWVRDQPWIDIVTNSWGLVSNLDWPPPPFGAAYAPDAPLTKAMVQGGKTVLFAAGNGIGVPDVTYATEYLVPGESTYTSQYTGPDWVVTVGATDPANGQPVAGSGRPVDISAAGLGVAAADGRTRSGRIADFAGTSAATPIAAGVFGHVLQKARVALGDVREGPRAGLDPILAQGAPRPDLPLSAPLRDGVLARSELQQLVFATARPCLAMDAWALEAGLLDAGCAVPEPWPFPVGLWGWAWPTPPGAYPALTGYGAVDAPTRDAAEAALLSGAPERPYADCWAKADSVARQRLWGTWTGGAQAAHARACSLGAGSWAAADFHGG